jgi:hypothetical protein
MKIKNVEMRTFFEIETEEGEIYRKDSFKYWEKYDGSESWSQLYPSDELVEMERLFQEYLKSKENEPMTYIKPLPDSMTAPWNGTPITDHTFAGIPPTTSSKTAYIPTPFDVPPELKVGDKWFVKLQGASWLTEQKIIEVTEKTVLLQQMDDSLARHAHLRYKKTDIEFVEKVNDE